ncbi:hypothetical protein K7432_010125 [Basidiobolus ranarum]|uniref:Uncharacterized protein n=1 Tax=Basidiobolus ranarum TaxID=34480 RepID=A0ABR2WPC3_9FUNG
MRQNVGLPKLLSRAYIVGLFHLAVKASSKRAIIPISIAISPTQSTPISPRETRVDIDPSYSYSQEGISSLLLGAYLGSTVFILAFIALVYLVLQKQKHRVSPEPVIRNSPNGYTDTASDGISEKRAEEIMNIMDAEEGYSASLHDHELPRYSATEPILKTSIVVPKPVKDGSWKLGRLKLGSKFECNSPTRKFLRDSYQVW